MRIGIATADFARVAIPSVTLAMRRLIDAIS